MTKVIKPTLLFVITIIIVNALTWIQNAASSHPTIATSFYTLSYTTIIICYGLIIEYVRLSRSELKINKSLLVVAVVLLILNYVPSLTLHNMVNISIIKYFAEPMMYGAGRVIVGIVTGMLVIRSILSSPR
jgi:hypothetical protein